MCTAVTAVKMASVLIFTSSSSGFLSGSSGKPPEAPSTAENIRDPKPSKTMEALLQLWQGEEVQVSRNIPLKGGNPEEDQAPPPAEGQLDKERRRR